MEATGDRKASFHSYSRWTLKRDSDVGKALDLFREAVRPAYAALPGCLELLLLEIIESREYLVIAVWDTRDDYDNWVRKADDWRRAHEDAFKQWQAVMDYEDEFQAAILFQG